MSSRKILIVNGVKSTIESNAELTVRSHIEEGKNSIMLARPNARFASLFEEESVNITKFLRKYLVNDVKFFNEI